VTLVADKPWREDSEGFSVVFAANACPSVRGQRLVSRRRTSVRGTRSRAASCWPPPERSEILPLEGNALQQGFELYKGTRGAHNDLPRTRTRRVCGHTPLQLSLFPTLSIVVQSPSDGQQRARSPRPQLRVGRASSGSGHTTGRGPSSSKQERH
jgi:hypothetical protein